MGNPVDLLAPGRLKVGYNRGDALGRDIMVVNNASGSAEKGHVLIESYEAALWPSFQLSRFRGTVAAPVSVAKDDQLGSLTYFGYVAGAATTRNAAVESYVDAAIVATHSPATRLTFRTAVDNTICRPVAHFSTEGYFAVGTAFDLSAAATRPLYPVHVVGSGQGETFVTAESYDGSAGNTNPTFRLGRARGTFAVPATVAAADIIGELEFFAYNNGAWYETGEVQVNVDAAPVAGHTPQTSLFLKMSNNAFGGQISRLALYGAGNLGFGEAGNLTQAQLTTLNPGVFYFGESSNSAMFTIQYSNASSNGATTYYRKSRGTLTAPGDVLNGDTVFSVRCESYSTTWQSSGQSVLSVIIDDVVVAGQNPALRVSFKVNANNAAPTEILRLRSEGNIAMIGTGSMGNAIGAVFIGNRTTAPTANPVGGGILYAEAGALKWRGSGGTTTTIANA
jgi:hypothetical protein